MLRGLLGGFVIFALVANLAAAAPEAVPMARLVAATGRPPRNDARAEAVAARSQSPAEALVPVADVTEAEILALCLAHEMDIYMSAMAAWDGGSNGSGEYPARKVGSHASFRLR